MKRCLVVFTALTLTMALLSPLATVAATTGITGACTWVLEGTVLTVSGDGAMADYTAQQPAPWGMGITTVHVEEGVTAIGDYAFANSYSLQEATIASTVKTVGDFAFSNNIDLATVTMQNGVEHIGDYAFSGCSDLLSIELPPSVITIGERAFAVSGLRTVQLSDSLITIGNYAFYYCASLMSANIPDSAVSIGAAAFYRCSKLNAITLGNGLRTIGTLAFCGCEALTSVHIPMGVTAMGNGVFSSCSPDLVIHCSTNYVAQYASGNGLQYVLTAPTAPTFMGTQACVSTTDDHSIRFGFTIECFGVRRDERYNTIPDDNATVNIDGNVYKLIGFGANAALNKKSAATLNGVDVPAKKLYSVNDDGTVTYTIRVTEITANGQDNRDTPIYVNGYVTYLDGDEVKTAVTGVVSSSYNQALAAADT